MAKEETSEQTDEKRKHERKSTNVQVEIITSGKLSKEIAKDISLSGIYVKKDKFDRYKVDEAVVLAFESKTGDAQTLEGKIVRKDDEGIGIRFKKELVSIAL